MAQTAVVTGATGFVATELVKELLAKVSADAAALSVIADATDMKPVCLIVRCV